MPDAASAIALLCAVWREARAGPPTKRRLGHWAPYNACSRSGARSYPYGSTFGSSACKGNAALGGSGAADVAGSRANCEGGFPGLFDLSGNVAEWEDACNGSTGVNDACRIRGGSFLGDAVGLRCDSSDTINRDNASTNVGFRCCAAR